MGKTFKKILCSLLVVVMCLTSAPLQGFVGMEWPSLPEINFGEFELPTIDFSSWFGSKVSAATKLAATGQCGDNVYWNYDSSTGELVISGTGAMTTFGPFGGGKISPFENSSIKSIVIESGVTNIGSNAFVRCEELIKIEFPSTVTSIGGSAFEHCKSLKKIKIPDSVTTIGTYAFYGCSSLEEILMSKNITEIHYAVFAHCINLLSITIPNSVTGISTSAFTSCRKLKSITIPDSVTSIQSSAFDDCSSLMSIFVDDNNKNFSSDEYGVLFNKDKTVLIRYPLGSARNNYTIPDSVISIDSSAFDDCSSLMSIFVDDNNKNFSSDECGVLFNKDKSKLIKYPIASTSYSYTVPSSVSTIVYDAFRNCENLTTINVDKNNKYFSSDDYGVLFNKDKSELIQYPVGNTKISYTIPDSVTLIKSYAFYCSANLEKISIPGSVTDIYDHAFYKCTNLRTVIIGYGVNYIGYAAFSYCDNIKDVGYLGTYNQWKSIRFNDYNNCIINANIRCNYTENLKLNYKAYTVSNFECPMIMVTQYPLGYTKDDIVWTSSNEHVIKMNGDVPEPIHSGKANVIATTKDGKYSGSCEVTVKASFVMTSPSNDTESIMEGKTAELYIYLNDFQADKLPVDDVKITLEGETHLKLLSKKVEDDCLKLKVKGLKSGYSIINVESKEYEASNRFQVYVYPESIEFRADKVPVLDEDMQTNFFRSGYTVEAFNYVYNEKEDTYTVTMNVYNEIGVSPVIVAYTNNGSVYDFAAAKRFVGMPGDFGEFLGTLANGLGQFVTGDMFTYRTQTYAEKTEIEVEVPSDGYITISNDRKISPFVAVYNAVALCIEMSFVSIDLVTGLTDSEKAKSKDVTEAFMKKLSDVVPDFNDLIIKIANKICKKSVDKISVETLAELSEYSFDMVNELCRAADYDFSEILYEVLADVLKKTFDTAIQNGIIKNVIRNNILTVENFKTLEKYTEPIFKAGEFIYLAEFILRYFNYSSNTGMTNIQFNPCGEEGFLCKDKIRVKSDVITDEVLLHHYVIIDSLPYDAFVRDVIHSDFKLDDQPDDKEISIDLNRIIEVHEISLQKDGKNIETFFRATVEIELPSYMNKSTCSVYRVEDNGDYTLLPTKIVGNNVVFETEHFSQYIITGIRNDIEGTTPCDKHVYSEVRTEATCTKPGEIIYTCYCGDTYTEVIPVTEHTFSDGNSKCSNCDFDRADSCSCKCHKSGIAKIIFKIILIFQKIFKKNRICEGCGVYHY